MAEPNLAALVVALADEVNRSRPLTDSEVDGVCLALWLTDQRGRARGWTQQDDAKLVRLTQDGVLAPQAALALNRSTQAIRSRLKRLKITTPHLIPSDRRNQYAVRS